MKISKITSNTSVGVLLAADVQTPAEANAALLEARGSLGFDESAAVTNVQYVSRFMMAKGTQYGFVQGTLQPRILPSVLSLQARLQGAKMGENYSIQLDAGPALNFLNTKLGDLRINGQFAERIHLEAPLLEHELTAALKTGPFGLVARGTLSTPLTDLAATSSKFYAEATVDLPDSNVQLMSGVTFGGKVEDWDDSAMGLAGVRVRF